ncbi:protein of unknown function [Denitratisoma oestradiolicum]|uniref:Uncharacterized protein n=1 Tax=Denitratisoma oestradiolicum TaxID=311182 RepID=A0A6S6XUA3_9PROT|nr:protein of unknown function [Denitratisoma oestradiolicum]
MFSVQSGRGQQVFQGRQVLLGSVVMSQVAQFGSVIFGLTFDGTTLPENLASDRRQQAHQHAQQAGFACSVPALQIQQFPSIEGKAEMGKQLALATYTLEILGLQHEFGWTGWVDWVALDAWERGSLPADGKIQKLDMQKSLPSGNLLSRRGAAARGTLLGHAVAALAREKGDEGDPVMAFAAVLSPENVGHADGCAAGHGLEGIWMAIGAGQPQGMGLVGKAHMGHFLGVAHDDVQVQHFHFTLAPQAFPGGDAALPQGAHPVWEAVAVVGQDGGGLLDPLQAAQVRIAGIVIAFPLKSPARRRVDGFHGWQREGRLHCRRGFHAGGRLELCPPFLVPGLEQTRQQPQAEQGGQPGTVTGVVFHGRSSGASDVAREQAADKSPHPLAQAFVPCPASGVGQGHGGEPCVVKV